MVVRNSILFKERTLYCAISWLFAIGIIADWANTLGATPLLHAENLVVVMLLLFLPLRPVIFASIIVVVCFVLAFAPFPSAGVYWLQASPVWLASAVLGKHIANVIIPSCAFVLFQSLIIVGSATQLWWVSSFAATMQPVIVAWGIGALIGQMTRNERERAAAEIQNQQRAHQLEMLHVLHDSVANNLVYALARLRSFQSNTPAGNNLKDVGEIADVLALSLHELRQQVIIPTRRKLDLTDARPISSVQSPGPTPESTEHTLLQTIQSAAHRLHEQGFIGMPQVIGQVAHLAPSRIELISHCVREVGGNIIKYGMPGPYALAIDTDEQTISILSSNRCSTPHPHEQSSKFTDIDAGTSTGLRLITEEISRAGGTVSTSQESGEWTIFISIPSGSHPPVPSESFNSSDNGSEA
ncbi:signal transduction histidine kinase [Bifidobacterium lemurum]|uniref:Signal transduction histidine kinase n=1 Tax=Bifidobacterium lemurum TaxID=1603886 RepID=A0A261FVN1_9BIFI|nr:hypothetical protein [Bifidobacterium lemurum]OZG63035.1 signal transduction histidine kinase [Bifidobacterium lemurum]QOL33374.1 hypothetical protein BL8807_05990 [Bifidobacterium lemurum]